MGILQAMCIYKIIFIYKLYRCTFMMCAYNAQICVENLKNE